MKMISSVVRTLQLQESLGFNSGTLFMSKAKNFVLVFLLVNVNDLEKWECVFLLRYNMVFIIH